MRRNVFNLSRIYLRSLSGNHELEKNILSKCFGQRRISGIPNGSKAFVNKFRTSRLYTDTKAINCWNCQRPMDIRLAGTKESFFCSSCGSLQEMIVNYVRRKTVEFDFFSLELFFFVIISSF